MRQFSMFLLVALMAMVCPSWAQYGVEFDVYPYNVDTLCVFPEQLFGVTISAHSIGNPVLLTAEYSFTKPDEVRVTNFHGTLLGTDGCGELLENEQDFIYRFLWNDRGDSCSGEGFGFLCCWLNGQNTMPPGTDDQYFASLTCYGWGQGSFDTYIASPLHRIIRSIDGIRGDVTDDGVVDWADVDSIEYYTLYSELSSSWLYREHGTNLNRGMTVFPYSTSIDGYLISLWLQNPTHPWVVNLGIGQLMSQRSAGAVVQVPATVEVTSDRLTIYTEGQVAAVMVRLPDGTLWWQSDFVSNGQVTFYGVPDGVTTEMVMVDAVVVPSAMGIESPLETVVPTTTCLNQNYPNPFNPSTNISFTLPRASQVSLRVYNLLGREVATLVNEPLAAGQHNVTFNGVSLPSGTYLYRLETSGFVETKKMILLK